MADSSETGLQHVGNKGSLSLGSRRLSMVARGRRETASPTQNLHHEQATAQYAAGNYAAAAAAFSLAAEHGHAESQYMLSTMLEAGEGVPQDIRMAAVWERRAAEQEHVYAQANVSFRYYAAAEFEHAFLWCERAAMQNLAWAQYNLGLMYRKGEGVPRDDEAAVRFCRMAAMQGFAEAQTKLAELHSLGQGVAQSHAEAAAWYRKAAEQGDREAQYQLGHCYAVGHGVEQDYVQSRHWIKVAARQGHAKAARELREREYRDPS